MHRSTDFTGKEKTTKEPFSASAKTAGYLETTKSSYQSWVWNAGIPHFSGVNNSCISIPPPAPRAILTLKHQKPHNLQIYSSNHISFSEKIHLNTLVSISSRAGQTFLW